LTNIFDININVSHFYVIELYGLHYRDNLHQPIVFLLLYDTSTTDFMDDASHPCDAMLL